jgi:hypothetical protein
MSDGAICEGSISTILPITMHAFTSEAFHPTPWLQHGDTRGHTAWPGAAGIAWVWVLGFAQQEHKRRGGHTWRVCSSPANAAKTTWAPGLGRRLLGVWTGSRVNFIFWMDPSTSTWRMDFSGQVGPRIGSDSGPKLTAQCYLEIDSKKKRCYLEIDLIKSGSWLI